MDARPPVTVPPRSSRGLLTVVTAVLLVGAVHADADWPRFRGPDANPVGTSPRLPTTWSVRENVEWKAAVPGRGWSSPVVVGRRVFLTTVTTDGASKPPQTGTDFSNDFIAELSKQGLSDEQVLVRLTERDIELPREVSLHYFLYCLDLDTGAVRWRQEFHAGRPPGGRHRKNSFVSETPVSDGRTVFVYVANLGVYAYSMDGVLRWKTPIDAYPMYLDVGSGGSPVLHDNQLIVVNDNEQESFIAAFDTRTGKRVWRTARTLAAAVEQRKSAWSSPFVWSHGQRTEIVTVGPAYAVSYDLSGKELWRLSGMSAAPIPSPFVHAGLLYLDGGSGGGLFAVKPGASGDVSLRDGQAASAFVSWSDPRGGTYLPTPVVYNGGVYKLSEKGILTRFDARSGTVTYKARLSPEAGEFTASPWAYNGRVYCLNEEGATFVVAAGDTFTLMGINRLDEMAQATPAIVGDRLLIRTEGHLYSIRHASQSRN
jgi:outer membrane protein assembly factor BamB